MSREKAILKQFSFRRVVIPMVLGLGVISYFIIASFDIEAYRAIRWSWTATLWLLLALCLMVVRDLAYIYRIKYLTGNYLTWGKSFQVIMLWEFSSAATPSVVGGSAAALYILNKEGISMGRTTGVVLFTTFLDELFYVVFAPLFFLLAGRMYMFPDNPECLKEMDIGFLSNVNQLIYIFILGYLVLFGYLLLVGYGLFINPEGVKRLIVRIFSLGVLRRWRLKAWQTGLDMIVTSREIQNQGAVFWAKTFGSTVLSWTARYFIINCIVMAFASTDDNFILFARQFVMWIIMLLPTTPGASGVAEISFLAILCEFIPRGLGGSLALLWRMLTYYPYLIAGVIVLPRWIRRVYSHE